MRWTPGVQLTCARKAYGEVVWACRPDAGGKPVRGESRSRMMVAQKQSLTRASTYKPSNHRAGKAGMLPLHLYARVRTFLCTLRTRPRVQASARLSLRPRFPREGGTTGKTRANHVARRRSCELLKVSAHHTFSVVPAKAGTHSHEW